MQVTHSGNIIIRHNLGRAMGYSCNFGSRWVSISISSNGRVSIGGALGTKSWVMAPCRRKELRHQLASILCSERQLKQMGL